MAGQAKQAKVRSAKVHAQSAKSRLLHRAKSTIDVHHLPNFDICTILLPSPETAFGTKVQLVPNYSTTGMPGRRRLNHRRRGGGRRRGGLRRGGGAAGGAGR